MDATKTQKLLEKSKEEYTSCTSKKTVDSCVEQFKKKIMEGPYYICCECNRTPHKKSGLKLNTSSYPSQDNHHMMEKNISARPVTQKPYKEDFHVRQLWTI